MKQGGAGRYARQIIMDEIGSDGQEKLGKSRVAVCGLGGLGSISALYLAAAGVGHLRIVDRDAVEISNLNRQLLHWSEDLGRLKTQSAQEKLGRLNPDCRIEALAIDINNDTALEIARDCSVIVDGADNLSARMAMNKASIDLGTPFIHGAVGAMNGMVTTFMPGQGPCLECLFPRGEENPAVVGILGATAGIIASIQALEAVKIVVGRGPALHGRLLYLYGSDMRWKDIAVYKNPGCSACGEKMKVFCDGKGA
ncbi:MAG: HesA/MoeB/ThiF family protein [Desulfobacteraceae bacterium]|nr:MAG: HesA/MoeB/ThiF family protein [Desulfobacteraceae bacterium]